jgi:hypothetical protein
LNKTIIFSILFVSLFLISSCESLGPQDIQKSGPCGDCGEWVDAGCGGTCAEGEMKQTRSCTGELPDVEEVPFGDDFPLNSPRYSIGNAPPGCEKRCIGTDFCQEEWDRDRALCDVVGGSCPGDVEEGVYEISCTNLPEGIEVLCGGNYVCTMFSAECGGDHTPEWYYWGCSCKDYDGRVCDDEVIPGEFECEPPGVDDTGQCQQEPGECVGPMWKEREDSLGDCGLMCECSYDPLGDPSCSVAECGALCEAGNMNGETCESILGADYTGVLDCNLDDCSFDTSGCIPPGVDTYLTCSNNQCVEVEGNLTDECAIDEDCELTCSELAGDEQIGVCCAAGQECIGDGVWTPGASDCPDSCCIYEESGGCADSTHLECNDNEQCIEVSGVGSNQCSNDEDCTITHLECSYAQCVEVVGDSVDQCTLDENCYGYYMDNFAGNGIMAHDGDGGPAEDASFRSIDDVAVDSLGNVYINDELQDVIRKVDITTGIINNYAGNRDNIGMGDSLYYGDGGPAEDASLHEPSGMFYDEQNDLLYFADSTHAVIRVIDLSTGIIDRVAGTPLEHGDSGDGGPALEAMLRSPEDVVLDSLGNIYIMDMNNHKVKKVVPNGTIYDFAGNGDGSCGGDVTCGDGGPATEAVIGASCANLEVDSQDNIYIGCHGGISEPINRVRMVDSDGIITTYAGTGVFGYSGDGGPATEAKLRGVRGLAMDSEDNLYIVDHIWTNRIRVVYRDTGIIDTFAGGGDSHEDGAGVDYTAITGLRLTPYYEGGYLSFYFGNMDNKVRKIVYSDFVGRDVSEEQTLWSVIVQWFQRTF